MRTHPILLKLPRLTLVGLWFASFPSASGQDISTLVGLRDPFNLDSLFSFGGGGVLPGVSQGLKGGISAGIATSTIYDSNLFLDETGQQGSVSSAISPSVSYISDPEGGARYSISAAYLPSYSIYYDDPDLNQFHNSGSVSFAAQGSRTTISLIGAYSQISGTDRLARQFVNGALFNVAIQGGYQLAPRTSVNAGASVSKSYYSGSGSVEGADVYGANAGAFWAATERLSFGPAMTYSTSESPNIGKRESWSFSGQANYLVDERIHIAGSLGVQWSQYSRESGGSPAGLTGGFDASYQLSELWSLSGSIVYVTVPSPSDLNFVVNDLTYSAAVSRQLRIGSLAAGANYTLSDYSSVGPTGAGIETDARASVFVSYGRAFLHERLGFNSNLSYSVNSGRFDYDQVTASVGVNVSF